MLGGEKGLLLIIESIIKKWIGVGGNLKDPKPPATGRDTSH